jgi:transcriptional regulator of acetoin/glycerol metabolism
LTQLVLFVPPLRSRPTEILSLAHEFAPELTFTPSAAEALLTWHWPGNIRELRALMGALAVLATDATPIRARDLADRVPSAERVLAREPAQQQRLTGKENVVERRKRLAELLAKYDGNVTEVARELGKPRAQIYRWLRAWGLTPGRRPRPL